MLSVSNLFLKQQDSFNISVFILYIFKWFYAFNKKEMSYEECVARITKFLQAVEEDEETLWDKNSEIEDELESLIIRVVPNKVEMKVKTNFPFTIGYVP
jgi:hypothetical protein